MSLPVCEICHEHNASILICLEHSGQSENHHVCMECVGKIADDKSLGLLNHSNLNFSKLQSILHQMQEWHEAPEAQIDADETATLQRLQAMMGNDVETDLDELANDAIEKAISEEEEFLGEPRCLQCGTSWKSIHEDGLVGCPHCYVSFAVPLRKVIKKLHESTAHIGKTPRFWEKQERLKEIKEKREQHRVEMLQRRLAEAIQAEDFEEAAQIRDKISQVTR